MIKKVGNLYCVYDSKGIKKLGCHRTREQALKQLRAIEISKRKR